MKKNLLLINVADIYSFNNSKEYMVDQINDFFISYKNRTRKTITEVLFIPYAYDGQSENTYVTNVTELFENISLKRISEDNAVQDVQEAQAIVIGGGSMNNLKPGINDNIDLKRKIIERVGAGIPYIAWNEASIFAGPKEVENLGADNSDMLYLEPFQIVCHYSNIQSQMDKIKAFLQDNRDIKFVVCLSDPKIQSGSARQAADGRSVVGTRNVNSESDEGGSGVVVEEDEAGLAGYETNAPVHIFELVDDELSSVPNEDVGRIM